jgi:hypothetical protein
MIFIRTTKYSSVAMESSKWKTGIYATSAVFAVWSVYLYLYNPPLFTWITREDSVSESVSAICYLMAACIFFIEWVRGGFRNIFVLGYALLFLFVGGEEISWGQRLVGIQTPQALMELNVQKEANLHNIDGIHQHVRKIGLLVVLTIAVLMPLTQRFVPVMQRLYARLMIPVVPLWTLPLTILSFIFMAVPRMLFDKPVFSLDEIGELYLSLVFLFFSASVRVSGTRSRRGATNRSLD